MSKPSPQGNQLRISETSPTLSESFCTSRLIVFLHTSESTAAGGRWAGCVAFEGLPPSRTLPLIWMIWDRFWISSQNCDTSSRISSRSIIFAPGALCEFHRHQRRCSEGSLTSFIIPNTTRVLVSCCKDSFPWVFSVGKNPPAKGSVSEANSIRVVINCPHGYKGKCHKGTSQPDPRLFSHTDGESNFHFVTADCIWRGNSDWTEG